MKKQYILMLTYDEVKALIEANENYAEILEKQAKFHAKQDELEDLSKDIQSLLK